VLLSGGVLGPVAAGRGVAVLSVACPYSLTADTPAWATCLRGAYAQPSRPSWKFDADWLGDVIAVAADGTIYIEPPRGQQCDLAAVTPDGQASWRLPLPGCASIAPVIDGDGTVFVFVDHSLLAIDPGGSIRWTLAVEVNGDNLTGAAIGAGGALFVAEAYQPRVYAFY
jgi:hypothetical protein